MAGGGEGVGIQESADFGVIISALQIIEAGFGVVDIAAVAEGVQGGDGGGVGVAICQGGGKGIAPGVVGVGHQEVAGLVHDAGHIALQVDDVEIGLAAGEHAHGRAVGSVSEVHGGVVVLHVLQKPAVVHILIGIGAIGTLRSEAVGVVGLLYTIPVSAVKRERGERIATTSAHTGLAMTADI